MSGLTMASEEECLLQGLGEIVKCRGKSISYHLSLTAGIKLLQSVNKQESVLLPFRVPFNYLEPTNKSTESYAQFLKKKKKIHSTYSRKIDFRNDTVTQIWTT